VLNTLGRGAALLLIAATSLAAQNIAVTGATVIDGTGKAPIADGVVVITNGRISAVGKAGTVQVPASTRTIDARGKYVIPGLMDANLHLFLNRDLETLIKYEGRYHEVAIEGAQIALKSGQTTVFDTWGPRDALIKARDMIHSGQQQGSRIYLAGNIIGFDGPLTADFRLTAAPFVSKAFAKRINETWELGTGRKLLWMYPQEVRDSIRKYAASGVDFLKYGASGHVDMNFLTFSPRAQQAIVEEGHRARKTVQAHVTSPESVDLAVEAGVDILTHGDMSGPSHPIAEETLKKINAGIEHPVLRSESRTIAADTIDPRVRLGEGHFNAPYALEELGMDHMEILKTATSNVAHAYKFPDAVIKDGKVVDLGALPTAPLISAKTKS